MDWLTGSARDLAGIGGSNSARSGLFAESKELVLA